MRNSVELGGAEDSKAKQSNGGRGGGRGGWRFTCPAGVEVQCET